MKAVGFFLTVFLSMLLVFLLATGEVRRWFSSEGQEGSVVEIVPRVDPASPGKNMLEFDFFDVQRAQLKFTIRAEFDQEELQLGSASIEEMTRLSLKNGVIVIPLSEEAARGMLKDLPSAGAGEAQAASPRAGEPTADAGEDGRSPRSSGKLSLEFESATYSRGSSASRGPLQVTLSRGKGAMDDGTEFFFEELLLLEARGEQGSYELRSAKPVKIEGPAFGVRSASGLQGKLTEGGQQDFQLLPPVRAILRPGASLGAVHAPAPATSPAGEDAKEARPAAQQSIAVVADGPLAIRQRRGPPPADDSTIHLSFEKNVVFYPVPPGAGVESLPPPRVERFECQKMEVELADASGKPTLRHGRATWDGGRVKAYLQRGTGDEVYILDGDRLEWLGTEAAPGAGSLPQGEAVLDGNPVLRGKGVTVRAARAIFRPQEDRIVLEAVYGRLDPAAAAGKGPRKRAPSPPGIELPEGEATTGPDAAPGHKAVPLLPPRSWELTADEADLIFTREDGVEAGGAPSGQLSRLVARSKSEALVEVRSVGDDPGEGAPAAKQPQVIAVGKIVAYHEVERKVVLESAGDIKPRFSHGTNWIEADRIHLFQEESTAWFDGEAHARLEDLEIVSRALSPRPAGESEGAAGAEKKPRKPGPGAGDDTSIDLDAAFLAVRFSDQDKGHVLRDVAARGSDAIPVRVTTIHGPRLRGTGQQLYWDHEKKVGFVAAGKAGPDAGDEGLARLDTEYGSLLAEKVTFDQNTWTVQLTRQARIVLLDKERPGAAEPALVITTGAAEVELFEGFTADGVERSGPLKHLGKIKSLRAQRSAERPIELRGELFTAQADECRWSASSRELRFTGPGLQEIDLRHPDFHGPIRAREVVFEEAKSLVSLRGDVHGEIVQAPTALGAARTDSATGVARAVHTERESPTGQSEPARAAPLPEKAMVWRFTTTALELLIGAGERPGAPALELKTLRARDKVDLRSADGSIQLRGDDLLYEHAARNLRIFSPDGRPQTLVFDGQARGQTAVAGAAADPAIGAERVAGRDNVHKIASQVIWLVLYENPYSVRQRGDPVSWLLVQFEKDVIGNFHVPVTAIDKRGSVGAGNVAEDTWKMVAERLTLYVDPAAPGAAGAESSPLRHVPWAEASGHVVFSSGALQATAERAIFEEAQARMTLLGNPARLSRTNESLLEKREIILQRVGDALGIRYRGGDAREPRRPPFEPATPATPR